MSANTPSNDKSDNTPKNKSIFSQTYTMLVLIFCIMGALVTILVLGDNTVRVLAGFVIFALLGAMIYWFRTRNQK